MPDAAVRFAVAGFMVVALFIISTLFDQWIDTIGKADRYDGDTAVWVGWGVFYTILLWAVIFAMFTTPRHAIIGLVTLLICFVASGWPMYQGEADRSRRDRQK